MHTILLLTAVQAGTAQWTEKGWKMKSPCYPWTSPVLSWTRLETGPEKCVVGPFHWASYQQNLRMPRISQLLIKPGNIQNASTGGRCHKVWGCGDAQSNGFSLLLESTATSLLWPSGLSIVWPLPSPTSSPNRPLHPRLLTILVFCSSNHAKLSSTSGPLQDLPQLPQRHSPAAPG